MFCGLLAEALEAEEGEIQDEKPPVAAAASASGAASGSETRHTGGAHFVVLLASAEIPRSLCLDMCLLLRQEGINDRPAWVGT